MNLTPRETELVLTTIDTNLQTMTTELYKLKPQDKLTDNGHQLRGLIKELTAISYKLAQSQPPTADNTNYRQLSLEGNNHAV